MKTRISIHEFVAYVDPFWNKTNV